MKQIELTSKLVVALIALVVFSAMTVPSVVAQSTSSPPIRANSVTSGSIKDGEVKTPDLADNAVTSPKIADGTIQEQDIADGVIPSGGVQPTVHIVKSDGVLVPAGGPNSDTVDCPAGEILTGGGFGVGSNTEIVHSSPADEDTWFVSAFGFTPSGEPAEGSVRAHAVCLDFSP